MEGIIFRILSKIAEPTNHEKGVTLTPGDSIDVLVKKVLGNQALLRYKGADIWAQLEAAVQEGTKLKCLVQGERDGKILLKLLPDTGLTSQKINELVDGLIKNLKLSGNELNRQLVQGMITQGLPVTADVVSKLAQMAKSFGLPSGEAGTLVLLQKHGITPDANLLQALREDPADSNVMGRQLADLKNALLALRGAGDLAKSAKPETIQLADRLIKALEQMTLRSGDGTSQLSEKLVLALRNLLPISASAVALKAAQGIQDLPAPSTQTVNPAQPPQQGTSAPTTSPTQTASLLQQPLPAQHVLPTQQATSMQQVSSTQQASPTQQAVLNQQVPTPSANSPTIGGSDTVESSGQSRAPGANNLLEKEIVPRLITLVENEGISARGEFATGLGRILNNYRSLWNSTTEEQLANLLGRFRELLLDEKEPFFRELQVKVSGILEKITVYQQLNKAAEPGQESILYFQSPAAAGDSEGAFELLIKIKKDLRGNKINYDNCHVLVSLNTLSYGLVQGRVKVHNRDLTCHFKVETTKAKAAFDKKSNDLRERLQSLGFNATVAPAEIVIEAKSLFQQVAETSEKVPEIGQIDLRI